MDLEMMNQTITQLTDIADELYRGNVNQGIARMNEVIPGIAVISTWMTDESMKQRLVEDALGPALEAMEQGDGTQLADVIVYELVELLEEFKVEWA